MPSEIVILTSPATNSHEASLPRQAYQLSQFGATHARSTELVGAITQMLQRVKCVLLLFGLLAFSDAASASDRIAEPAYVVVPKIFNADDGLPQAGITTMLQASDGYLWIGTFGGLARFDGNAFTVFRTDHSVETAADAGRKGPASDRIIALYEDDTARLWIGTQDAGLNVYRDGIFTQLSVCGGTCQVNDIVQAAGGAIWVATNEGVLRLDPRTLRETWIVRSEERFTCVASDDQGQIYVGGIGGLFSVVNGRLRRIPLPGNERIVWMIERSGDGLMVVAEHAPLRNSSYRYFPRERRWRPLGFDPINAARDVEGKLWLLQRSGAVMREDGLEGWKNVLKLPEAGTTSMTLDSEGNLWAGTTNEGLLRVRKPLFGIMSAPQLGTHMPGRAVISDGSGGVWLGTACGGLHRWTRDGHMRSWPIMQALGSECVNSLLPDQAGDLWIGSISGGLARVKGGKSERVIQWKNEEPVNLWQLKDGRYVAAVGHSTYVIKGDADGRVSIDHRIEVLQGIRINNVVPAKRGGHWFVGDQGVLRLVDGTIVERWTPEEGLSSRFARALFEDDETGDLWVGTYGGGLNRIANGAVRVYDSRNGLLDDAVSCILKDASGRLWLGGNRGVTLLPSPNSAGGEMTSVMYGLYDGLSPSEINGGTSTPCHRDDQGRLWFSLVQGFGVLDAENLLLGASPKPPSPRIERVAASGHELDTAATIVTLEPFTRNLEIRYTAINLTRPRETRFRFRFSGVDREWVDAGQNRSVLYSSVPWGRHLFEVQASVPGSGWSPLPAKLVVVHPQPWYLHPWVWTFFAILLGFLVLIGSSRTER
jgi:ligand-binding sensor domain-containing protein